MCMRFSIALSLEDSEPDFLFLMSLPRCCDSIYALIILYFFNRPAEFTSSFPLMDGFSTRRAFLPKLMLLFKDAKT